MFSFRRGFHDAIICRDLKWIRSFSCQKKVPLVVPNRSFIEVSGKDVGKFLQGISTNDVTHLLQCSGSFIASAFLTSKGRIFADCLMYSVNGRPNALGSSVIIETHSSLAAALAKYLAMYRLRSDVKISFASDLKVVLGSGGAATEQNRHVLAVCDDPRIPAFGRRRLVAGGLEEEGSALAEPRYTKLRILHGLSEGPEVVNKIPLECNLDLLNFIDFNKGCYVGQELIARTKFKGLVRKRIVPFIATRSLPLSSPIAQFHELSEEFHETLMLANARIEREPEKLKLSVKASTPKGSAAALEENDSERGGNVLAFDHEAGIGLALLRLEHLNLVHELVINDEEAPLDVAAYRPRWWKDVDPVTGHDLIPPQ